MKNNPIIEQAGGILYLANLAGQLVSTAHLEEHAALVFDAYISRRVMIYASQLVQMAQLGKLTGEDLLLEAYRKLEAIEHDIPAFNAMQDARSVIDRSKQAGMERIKITGRDPLAPASLPDYLTWTSCWEAGKTGN